MRVTDISDFDSTKLVIKAPKLYDDSYICKLKYKSEVGSDKVMIDFGAVHVLQAKSGSLIVKLERSKIKRVLEMQEHVVEYAKGSVHKWFDRKIQPHVVEDMFLGSVTVHEKHGKVLKLRLASPLPHELATSGKLVMRLESIRFQRTSFNMLWELVEYTPSSESYLFDSSSDDDSVTEEEAEVEPYDEQEIMQALKSDLLGKLAGKKETVIKIVEDLENQVENANLNELEELSGKIENIFSNNNIVL